MANSRPDPPCELRVTNAYAPNPVCGRLLLLSSRHRIPILSRLIQVILGCDTPAPLPRSTILPHPYGIVLNDRVQWGEGVTIMQQVTVGHVDRIKGVGVQIGDWVYLGPGAKILGVVTIGEGAVIGANAVVTRDVAPWTTVVGANRVLPGQHGNSA